jgi:hypothetical protein
MNSRRISTVDGGFDLREEFRHPFEVFGLGMLGIGDGKIGGDDKHR